MKFTKELLKLRNEAQKCSTDRKLNILLSRHELDIILSWIEFLKMGSNLKITNDDLKLCTKLTKHFIESGI